MKPLWLQVIASCASVISGLCAVGSVWLALSTLREANAAKRPYINIAAPGIKPLPKSPPYRIQINMENTGTNTAVDLRARLLMFDQSLKSPPVAQIEISVANDIPSKTPTPYYNDAVLLPQNHPPQFIVLALKYNDAITKKAYSQVWYMKWDGIVAGVTNPDFVHVSPEEKTRIIPYIDKYLRKFGIE